MKLNNLRYDHNYYYYKIFMNNNDVVVYEIVSEDQLYIINELDCKIININKNIPRYFHKIILHFYFLHNCCICCN